jgi:microcystin degradation protein MlrC
MRIGVIALQHESNTFLDRPTTLEDFRREVLATGPAVLEYYRGGHHEVSGFFEGLGQTAIEVVPIFAAAATPGGIVTAQAYQTLMDILLAELERAGRLDGMLVAPHGAGVSQSEADMDGHWLSEVRQRIGAAVPMICTIDPHANLSERMISACQAIIPYRTNPHVDQRQRGVEAALLLARVLHGHARPTMAAAFVPVAINIACQHTESSPCKELIEVADAQRSQPDVLANGVVLGFPYADVPEMGSSFVVTSDNDPTLATQLANELAAYLVERRHDFDALLPDIDQAIDEAVRSDPPVCLLDLGDNVGGGSPGDGTLIAQALLKRGVNGALVCLCDAESAKQAIQAGAGATVSLRIGGKGGVPHGEPLCIDAQVRSLHDGQFEEPEVRHGGKSRYNMGPTAVVTAQGLTVLIHSLRVPPFSLRQLTSCGLDVSRFRIVVAKGVNAPLAAYGPVCRTFIRVDTPGVTTARMTRLPFVHRRRPLFPFEELA